MPRLRRSFTRARFERIHYWIAAIGSDFFDVYASDNDRRDAYLDVESDLLADYVRECPGQRPRNWWRYTACEPQPCECDEPKRLAELGALTPEEAAILAAQGDAWTWKRFDAKRWAAIQSGEQV